MRIRRMIVTIIAALGIASVGTACSSSDGQSSVGSSKSTATPVKKLPTDDETFEPEASLAPSPPALDAESAEPDTSSDPESEAHKNSGRPLCDRALERGVIDVTVPERSKVVLATSFNSTRSYTESSNTCSYSVRGSDSFNHEVAFVTVAVLNGEGKRLFRESCAKGITLSDNLVGKPIGYQYYHNIDDGCTFLPKRNAPVGTLPGFVVRYRDMIVSVYMKGFDTVENNGADVIREVQFPKS